MKIDNFAFSIPLAVGDEYDSQWICVKACTAIGASDGHLVIGVNGEEKLANGELVPKDSLKTLPKQGMTRTEALVLGQYERCEELAGQRVLAFHKEWSRSYLIIFDDHTYHKEIAEEGYENELTLMSSDLTWDDLTTLELVTAEQITQHELERREFEVRNRRLDGIRSLQQARNLLGDSEVRNQLRPTDGIHRI